VFHGTYNPIPRTARTNSTFQPLLVGADQPDSTPVEDAVTAA